MMYSMAEVKYHVTTRAESFDLQDSVTPKIDFPIPKWHVRSQVPAEDRDNSEVLLVYNSFTGIIDEYDVEMERWLAGEIPSTQK